ncbi:bifunctional hydroxymethylpyrimidine kinase/phosphomethylpyrimidine kinase [Marinobacter sp. X15-166B]|uniref:bifunctional hydroxymethylpyrimidine kinase/phosphomethylpyrimidine kinase n=1 Tax=Marinobacter sp. X15-166B TaxID=1897620 RepID=UPI00085C103B|nr:hydroxymethylpyrimidine/phosphomethylpyrimidine kinase [Marinobacter sp. X15-166B]OEY67982.1 hydroxymethylpyrimidine/phosphomethylpyrimidine kinase [Marinobacter sp. X15-166B]
MVLSGLDPSGGAGIQADIQAITALGAHPLPVLTCLTVQDTCNVHGATPVEAELIRAQLECLEGDTPIHAVKTGALGNAGVVAVLLEFLTRHPELPLIVDPVIKAAGGGDLADQALIESMTQQLFSHADVITPNGVEVALLGHSDQETQAVARLLDAGCPSVLVTGGHGEGPDIINTLYRQQRHPQQWAVKRVGGEYHGTGCTLAAAIAAGRAAGLPLEAAIESAQRFVSAAIDRALAVGSGQPVPDRSTAPSPASS